LSQIFNFVQAYTQV